VQGQVIYSSDSRSDIIEINAADVEGYATLGLRTGLTSETWSAELFVDNVTNENAELANNYINDRERVTRDASADLRDSLRHFLLGPDDARPVSQAGRSHVCGVPFGMGRPSCFMET
jgi:uncharacterized protein YgfB (UPF0149 family)